MLDGSNCCGEEQSFGCEGWEGLTESHLQGGVRAAMLVSGVATIYLPVLGGHVTGAENWNMSC